MCHKIHSREKPALEDTKGKGERIALWGGGGLYSVGQCNVCVMGVGGLWCAYGCGVWYVCAVCEVCV